MKKWYSLIIILFLALGLQAQDCFEYHLKKCDVHDSRFKLSAQSKSALFKKGHCSSFSFKAMEGYEYFIQLCCDDNLEGISLTVSNEGDKDIYSIESGDRFVNLVAEYSTDLTIKVDVPLGDVDIESVPYEELYGCVGIRIEYLRFEK